MTLLELCEPLFLYMSRLNRSARKGGAIDIRQARGEIEALLAETSAKATEEPGLAAEYEKVEDALVFFVDSMIVESDLPFARQWHEDRLAFERNELAGDEKFFDILEETLAEKGRAANERVAVLYSCIGLGFVGWYAGQPEYLRTKMAECAARMRGMMDTDDSAKICPDAYDHVHPGIPNPPGAKLLGIVIALAALILVILAVNTAMYHRATKDMRQALDGILEPTAATQTLAKEDP